MCGHREDKEYWNGDKTNGLKFLLGPLEWFTKETILARKGRMVGE